MPVVPRENSLTGGVRKSQNTTARSEPTFYCGIFHHQQSEPIALKERRKPTKQNKNEKQEAARKPEETQRNTIEMLGFPVFLELLNEALATTRPRALELGGVSTGTFQLPVAREG
jgi:hypothetical protein